MTKRKCYDGKAKPEFQGQVLKAMPLPPAWVTGRQLYELMDVGSLSHVKGALNEFVKSGKVRKWGLYECPIFQRADLPEFKPNKETLALVRQYQKDLAEWKER